MPISHLASDCFVASHVTQNQSEKKKGAFFLLMARQSITAFSVLISLRFYRLDQTPGAPAHLSFLQVKLMEHCCISGGHCMQYPFWFGFHYHYFCMLYST
ncbi:hypothetical protein DsansV1_C29g0209751 [Dioscorea sansibarensis]